jgi:hypothetical protein
MPRDRYAEVPDVLSVVSDDVRDRRPRAEPGCNRFGHSLARAILVGTYERN